MSLIFIYLLSKKLKKKTNLFSFQLLAKFPVIQHVLFGSILEFKKIAPGTILPTARLGMLPPRRIPDQVASAAPHLHPPPTAPAP